MSLDKPLKFLDYLSEKGIKTTLRQVIIPGLNDTEENIIKLKNIARGCPSVDKIELLPFKKICEIKYNNLGIEFPFRDIPTPDKALMDKLNSLLED